MKKQSLFFISLSSILLLASCNSTPIDSKNSEGFSSEQSEQRSSANSSSSQSESQISSSEEPIVIDEKISLFNNSSKLYVDSLRGDKVSTLRTYRHKDFNDVPYLDFEEYHYAIRPYIERSRRFTVVDNNTFKYSHMDESANMLIDAEKDVVTIDNANSFYLDAIGVNNGIYGDITFNNLSLYKGTDKTKYIQKGKEVTINLKDYDIDLVANNNRLYVPLGFINALAVGPVLSGICTNGKDFFIDSFIRNQDLSVYARSGNLNFSWPFGVGENPSAFKNVRTIIDEEAYRFEGILGEQEERDDKLVLELFKDGTGSLNGTGSAAMTHKAIAWKLEDDILKLRHGQTAFDSRDLSDALGDISEIWINTKETDYGKVTRSKEMAKATYNELCLQFDYNYGLKSAKGIDKFDTFFTSKGLKESLTSQDVMVYQDAFAKFICKEIDDIHSTINGGESVYSNSSTKGFFRNKSNEYKGDRNKAYYAEINRLGNVRSSGDYSNMYAVEGSTAYLYFQMFTHNSSSFKPITDKEYKTENYEAAQKAYQASVNINPYKAFCIAFNDIAKNENIKNVVIDITSNIGGEIRCAPYMASFMTKDPSIVIKNHFDDSIIDFHYAMDLNGDGEFGKDDDTFAGKYRFYILQGANFSCGNEFSTMAKNGGFAKLIGFKSAGGSCCVGNHTDLSGLTYKMSTELELLVKNGDEYVSNDSGIEPDYTLPFDDIYNLKKIDQFLNTL